MKLSAWNRRVHYWAVVFLAVPTLIIVGSGVLLQLKKHWTWVQPQEQGGTGTIPRIDFDQILVSAREGTDLGITGWADIRRLDVRPGRGMAKVWLQNGWEIQVDLGTGRVLQTAYRRSDVIESIHDGSFFGGDLSKLGVFLPSGIALLLMWITGIGMFWHPLSVKRKRKAARPDGPTA